MEVFVKVLKNGTEIAEAEARNQKKANQRINEGQKAKKDRVEVLADEVVPKKEIVKEAMLIDGSKVDMITIGSEGMFGLLYLNKSIEVVNDPNVWNQIKKHLEAREKATLK